MILAFHSVITAYGFWLPNEPRGSWSDFVASWELARFGPATTVATRRSIAARPYDRSTKRRMQAALNHAPVSFDDDAIAVIAAAFGQGPCTLHALAVMPQHAHAVVAHTDRDIRRVMGHLKSNATRALRERGRFTDRTPWADHGWNVFLDCDADVERCVRYVEDNPVREGRPPQRWPFVVAYDADESRAARARRKRRG